MCGGRNVSKIGEKDSDGLDVHAVAEMKEEVEEVLILCDALKRKAHAVLEKISSLTEIQDFYGMKDGKTLEVLYVLAEQ